MTISWEKVSLSELANCYSFPAPELPPEEQKQGAEVVGGLGRERVRGREEVKIENKGGALRSTLWVHYTGRVGPRKPCSAGNGPWLVTQQPSLGQPS